MKPIYWVLIIIVLILLYYFLVYKKTSNPVSNVVATITGQPQLDVTEYYVNGDMIHDKGVFTKGLDCAKAFVYKSNTDPMANNLLSLLALAGRGKGVGVQCKTEGLDCTAAAKISSLSNAQSTQILNYLNSLNVDTDYKRFADMAIGNKNMCSVILDDALKTQYPFIWATVGRG